MDDSEIRLRVLAKYYEMYKTGEPLKVGIAKWAESWGVSERQVGFAFKYLVDSGLLNGEYVSGTDIPLILDITAAGIDAFESHQEQASANPTKSTSLSISTPDIRNVFVVHGRNEKLRMDLFSFLRAIGLNPIEFAEAIKLTGKTSPYIGEILDAAFRNARAVVVLLSPDDEARLKVEFQKSEDPPYEKELTPQPRQNVLFEAGLAFGYKPDRTILVKVGELRPFSDIYGRHEVRLTNDPGKRQDLANRLKNAGCDVRTEGTDWLTIGEFESILPPSKKAILSEAKAGIGLGQAKEMASRIDMQEAKRIALEQIRLERPESGNAKVDSAQLIGSNWVISGYWTESGAKSFGSTNFEVVIDSVTKQISKVSFTPGFAMAVG